MSKQTKWEIKKLQIIGVKFFSNEPMTQEELANLNLEEMRFFKDEWLAALAAA